MNQRLLTLCAAAVLTLSLSAQVTIPEPADPSPVSPECWQPLSQPRVGWGSTDVRYLRSAVAEDLTKSLALRAWKGERVQAQAVISTPSDIAALTVSVSDLRCGAKTIAAANVGASFVRYVLADTPADLHAVQLLPDLLSPDTAMAVGACTTRPVWLDICVPATAAPGKYTGRLTLTADGQAYRLPFTLEVIDRTLPEPSEWAFHLDLWQNPYAVARYFGVPLWSQEHFDRMRPIMERLAAAGEKVITCSIIQHPWNSQTYDPFESMIAKMKQTDGTWRYDYQVFDRWVEFMMSCGITQQIDCYTLVPWHYQFEYYDCATNTVQTLACRPGEAAYREFLLPFLTDFARHLKAKGWFERTCISMDERPLDQLEAVWTMIREADPGYRIEGAANFNVGEGSIGDRMYDLSIAYNYRVHTGEALCQRLESGQKLTFYTCCGPARPNTFVYSLPAESTYLGWHAAAIHYSGYLRWAYCSWPDQPVQDTRFGSWHSGDTFLTYPEGSSIRFQRLIEGIQDYEKIRLLRPELSTRQQARLDRVLEKFSHNAMDDDFDVNALVSEGKAVLRALE